MPGIDIASPQESDQGDDPASRLSNDTATRSHSLSALDTSCTSCPSANGPSPDLSPATCSASSTCASLNTPVSDGTTEDADPSQDIIASRLGCGLSDRDESGSEPDAPLGIHVRDNAARQESRPERYIPWTDGSILVSPEATAVLPRVLFWTGIVAFVCWALPPVLLSLYLFRGELRIEMLATLLSAAGMAILGLIYYVLLWIFNRRVFKRFWFVVISIVALTFFSGYLILAIHAGFSPRLDGCYSRGFSAFYTLGATQLQRLEANVERFRGCEIRVAPQQSSLFSTDMYIMLFGAITKEKASLYKCLEIDMGKLAAVQSDEILCHQGFQGNSDLYGLGIRIGIYLQWVASLLTNNLLPSGRDGLQKTWLFFAMAICVATFVSSLREACVFGIEIPILYWSFWGGFFCVFASAPSRTRMGQVPKWVSLDPTTAIHYVTLALMASHGFWFLLYGYDWAFVQSPCGTYHFFLVPIQDPGRVYGFLKDTLVMLSMTPVLGLLLAFPLIIFLLLGEIKRSIQSSAIYRTIFPDHRSATDRTRQNEEISLPSPVALHLMRMYRGIKSVHHGIRDSFGLPYHSRRGIRLITPMDLKDRRSYRIKCLVLGLVALILSITAIETTLKWNRIVGINSVTSTGQYIPLIVGICTLVNVIWGLSKQEGRRRIDLRRRRFVGEDVELQPIDGAVAHAFRQPDVGFLSNDGAFRPTPEANAENTEPSEDGVYMSGAISSV